MTKSASLELLVAIKNKIKDDPIIKSYIWDSGKPNDYRIFFDIQPDKSKIIFPFIRISINDDGGDIYLPVEELTIRISVYVKGSNADIDTKLLQNAIDDIIDNRPKRKINIKKVLSIDGFNQVLFFKESSFPAPTESNDVVGIVSTYKAIVKEVE